MAPPAVSGPRRCRSRKDLARGRSQWCHPTRRSASRERRAPTRAAAPPGRGRTRGRSTPAGGRGGRRRAVAAWTRARAGEILDNSEAIEAWDGPLFDRFVQFRGLVTDGLGAHGERALALHPPLPGERVIDIGCGFGDTAHRIAGL